MVPSGCPGCSGLWCLLQPALCQSSALADLHPGCGVSHWCGDDREVLPAVLQGGLWIESWTLGENTAWLMFDIAC